MKPLRILYVSQCWPHDKCHGGQLRALQVARALDKIGDLTMVIAGAHEVDEETRIKSSAEFTIERDLAIFETPIRGYAGQVSSFLNRDFTNIHGLGVDPKEEAWLVNAHRQFDVVWFFKLRTANFFRNACWRRSVLDIDDLPSSMEKRFLTTEHGAVNKAKILSRLARLHLHEKQLSRRFNVLAVCSEVDRLTIEDRSQVHVIPNGFDRPAETPLRLPATPPRIGFMGLYSYKPNIEGVSWFIEHCWPEIKAKISGVTLRLVGQDSDGPLKPADPAVKGLGWVKDPAGEVASWSLMIVPIQSGAGTRVKIADAFSRKCPVVSTRFGALGYDVQHGRELLFADEPRDFANACISLIQDQQMANRLADQAYKTFLENWTWEAIAPRVWNAAEDSLRLNWNRTPVPTP